MSAPLPLMVQLKPEFFDKKSQMSEHLRPNRAYTVYGTVGSSLLLLGEDHNLVEVYPRQCLYLHPEEARRAATAAGYR